LVDLRLYGESDMDASICLGTEGFNILFGGFWDFMGNNPFFSCGLRYTIAALNNDIDDITHSIQKWDESLATVLLVDVKYFVVDGADEGGAVHRVHFRYLRADVFAFGGQLQFVVHNDIQSAVHLNELFPVGFRGFHIVVDCNLFDGPFDDLPDEPLWGCVDVGGVDATTAVFDFGDEGDFLVEECCRLGFGRDAGALLAVGAVGVVGVSGVGFLGEGGSEVLSCRVLL
jgi:hypothetical protein